MGVLDRWRRARMRQPQKGTFTIAALKLDARTPGYYMVFDVDGVVSGPGISATPVHRSQVMVRERDRLYEGQVLSVTYDAKDPRRCVIEFPPTDVARSASRADRSAAAQQLAAEMNDTD